MGLIELSFWDKLRRRLNILEPRVDNIVVGQDLDPNKDVEVLDARTSANTGVVHATIGARMNEMEKHTTIVNELDVPIATLKFRLVNGQPQLVTEEL